MLVVVLIVESLLFGMFTACMALDQWQVVSSGQTQIDRLKVRGEARRLVALQGSCGASGSMLIVFCGASGSMLIVVLIVESLLFGMFTACTASDQWQVVSSGQT